MYIKKQMQTNSKKKRGLCNNTKNTNKKNRSKPKKKKRIIET